MEPYLIIVIIVLIVAVFLSMFIKDVEDEELEPKCFDCANFEITTEKTKEPKKQKTKKGV